jgi:hypothetical protein
MVTKSKRYFCFNQEEVIRIFFSKSRNYSIFRTWAIRIEQNSRDAG